MPGLLDHSDSSSFESDSSIISESDSDSHSDTDTSSEDEKKSVIVIGESTKKKKKKTKMNENGEEDKKAKKKNATVNEKQKENEKKSKPKKKEAKMGGGGEGDIVKYFPAFKQPQAQKSKPQKKIAVQSSVGTDKNFVSELLELTNNPITESESHEERLSINANSASASSTKKKKTACTICGKLGHYAPKCPLKTKIITSTTSLSQNDMEETPEIRKVDDFRRLLIEKKEIVRDELDLLAQRNIHEKGLQSIVEGLAKIKKRKIEHKEKVEKAYQNLGMSILEEGAGTGEEEKTQTQAKAGTGAGAEEQKSPDLFQEPNSDSQIQNE